MWGEGGVGWRRGRFDMRASVCVSEDWTVGGDGGEGSGTWWEGGKFLVRELIVASGWFGMWRLSGCWLFS